MRYLKHQFIERKIRFNFFLDRGDRVRINKYASSAYR